MDSLRRRIPFKATENQDDDDTDLIYDEQRVFNYFLVRRTWDQFVLLPEQEFVIENLRQEANIFNRKALISLRIVVGLSCIMYGLFHFYSLLSSSFLFLVSFCSIISRITHFLWSSLRMNPYFRPLCMLYLALLRFSYTIFSRLISQVGFVSIFIRTVTIHQHPIDSSTRSLCWLRPHVCAMRYRGRLPFGGHTRLS